MPLAYRLGHPAGTSLNRTHQFYTFNLLSDDLQEPRPRRAVDRLVVAGERQAEGLDEFDCSFGAHRLELQRAHAENRDLRQVDQRRERLDPEALSGRASSRARMVQNVTRWLIVMSGTPGDVLIRARSATRPEASADACIVYWGNLDRTRQLQK